MSSERQLADQKARDRIIADLDRNLLVEAGAGSGKTYQLARRMAAGIATGVYQVEHISAVTFTRKAAAELRGRFQLALEEELTRNLLLSDASDRVARIRNALSNLERFFAGTIHSFCAHLLRERPVEAGVSPGFTELDEERDAMLRKQSWRAFLIAAKASGDPTVAELLDGGIKPKDLDSAFETICLYEEVEFPPGDALRPDTAAGYKALDKFWAAMRGMLPTTIAQDTTCKTQKSARRFYGLMRIEKSRQSRPGSLAGLLAVWDFEPGITQNRWSAAAAERMKIAAEITNLHNAFRTGVIQPYLAAWRQYIYRLSITLLANARTHAASERRRNNTLNFGDLLQLAARVLRGNAEVRRALQSKYRWLFVDEFQDIDPVQAEIIFLLAGEEPALSATGTHCGGAAPVDWRATPLRRGTLFVVGDPKQSIYRFRRADIEIYNVVSGRLTDPSSGELLSLTTNFRSAPDLCEWANNVFRQKFPSEPTAYSPKFAPLDAHGAKNPRADEGAAKAGISGVHTLTIPASVNRGEVPAAEADRIASFIRSEVDAKRRSFGDFLVLTRKRKHLTSYVEALEELQVPLEVSGAGAFGDSEQVAHLALLLRALSNPQDRVSLVGVLRGPFFGVSDQDLFAFRQAGGWFSIFGSAVLLASPQPASSNAELQACSAALASLNQMLRWTRALPAGAALERILEHTGYLALAATTAGGAEAGDLLHAIDRVRQRAEEGHSLAAAASALEDGRDISSEVESLPLEPGRSNVVRVMNLHKAKGLEASVVFLADPCGGFEPRADIRIIRDGLTARGYFSITSAWGDYAKKVLAEPAGWNQFKQEEQTYLAAEEHRLLYVSATRARDMLVVGRWAKSGGGGVRAWEAFEPFLGGVPELPVPAMVGTPAPQPVDLSQTANIRAAAMRKAAHDRARVPSWAATSVTAEEHHVGKLARTEESVDDPTRAIAADTPSHRADAGLAWGTLIHGLLEHSMRHPNATRDDLRRLAMWLTVEEPQLRIAIDEALQTVDAVATTDFWEKAKSSEHHAEVPFCLGAFPPGGKIELTSGIMDLVYRIEDYWNVIDYKTDRSGLPSIAKYGAQLSVYREMWQKMTGGDVRAELVSTRVPSPRL